MHACEPVAALCVRPATLLQGRVCTFVRCQMQSLVRLGHSQNYTYNRAQGSEKLYIREGSCKLHEALAMCREYLHTPMQLLQAETGTYRFVYRTRKLCIYVLTSFAEWALQA